MWHPETRFGDLAVNSPADNAQTLGCMFVEFFLHNLTHPWQINDAAAYNP